MQKIATKLVALSLAIMLIFSANSSAISSLASELTGGGTQANKGIQMPVQALEDEEVQPAESEDLPSQEEISPEDENTTEESSEETEENTSQTESNEEAEDTAEGKLAEETEQADLVQTMAEEQALSEGGIDLSFGPISVEKGGTDGTLDVTYTPAQGETATTTTISNTDTIKIIQSNPTTATTNTITVGNNCGEVNIVLSGVNIATATGSAMNIGSGSPTTISTEGENKLSGYTGIYSRSELTLSGAGSLDVAGTSSSGSGYGINATNITINSGTVNATGSNDGINANSNVEISGGTVTATGTNCGIGAAFGNVKISGGTVNAGTVKIGKTTYTSNCGIDAVTVDISQETEGTETNVTAAGTNRGIYADAVTISGGTVTAAGTIENIKAGGEGSGYGISAINATINGGTVNAGTVKIGDVTYTSTTGISAATVEISQETEGASTNVTTAGTDCGIYAYSVFDGEGGTVEGTGELTISGGEVSAIGTIADIEVKGHGESYGINATKVTISQETEGVNTNVTATGTIENTGIDSSAQSYGIRANNGVEISGGTVTATGTIENIGADSYAQSYGIHANNGVEISGGIVTAIRTIGDIAEGGGSERYGIYANNGIEISGGTVTATEIIENIEADGEGYSYGIYAADVTISSGEVTTTATANSGDGYGIHANANLAINGGTVSATGTASNGSGHGINATKVTISQKTEGASTNVTATGKNYGIYAYSAYNEETPIAGTGEVTISGGEVTATVTATGAKDGIYADETVTISGGTVTATGAEDGIYAYGNVEIRGGTVNAGTIEIGETTYTSKYGIYAATVEISQAAGASTKVTATGTSYGIYAYLAKNGETPIAGTGEVTISGGTVNATGTTNDGIYATNVTISGGTVTATGTDDGIYARGIYNSESGGYIGGTVTISGGEVSATGADAGIDANETVTISGGEVSAIGTTDGSTGISANSDVTISDGTVTSIGKDDGIYSGNDVTISGGTITTTATMDNGIGYGIYSNGNVVISGGAITAGMVEIDETAYNPSCGIRASVVNVRQTEGTSINVRAAGANYGISADKGNVEISGGDIESYGGSLAMRCKEGWTITLPSVGYALYKGEKNSFADATYTQDILNDSATGTNTKYVAIKPIEYTVRFYANDGTDAVTEQTFIYDKAQKLAANTFTRPGYTFQGWSTDKDESTIKYKDEESVINLTGTKDNPVALYAVWANVSPEAAPTVTYKANYDGSTQEDVTVEAQEESGQYKITLDNGTNTFTRAGYTLLGWSKTEGATAVEQGYEIGKEIEISENLVLYAVWENEDASFDLYYGPITVSPGESGGVVVQYYTKSGGSTAQSKNMAADSIIEIIQSNPTTATTNTITVGQNCGEVNIVLSDVNIKTTGNAINIGSGSPTTISTEGENKLSGYTGIYSRSELTLSGAGTLDVAGTSSSGSGYGINATNITINSGTVNATGTASSDHSGYGISATNATINGGEVTATGTDCGIYAYLAKNGGTPIKGTGEVTISGGTVTANSTYTYGIYAINVTISQAAGASTNVTATGTNLGIYAYLAKNGGTPIKGTGEVTISGGTVTANSEYNGIYAINVTISDGIVTATGTSTEGLGCGISAKGNIAISGGTVTATGTNCGIYAYNDEGSVEGTGNVTISGGTVNAGTVKIDGNTYTSKYGIRATTVEISQAADASTNVTATGTSFGIYAYSAYNGGTLIEGTGEVTINGGTVNATGTASNGSGNGIRATNVTISNGTVMATGTDDGICAYGNVEIRGGTVSATGADDGIYADETVTINGGTVNATGSDDGIYARGIYNYESGGYIGGTVTISGGEVSAIGTDDGIYANEAVAISGGTVNATGTSTEGLGCGISAKGNIAISGGTVTATGTNCGIYAYNDEDPVEGTGKVTVNGGTVNAGTVEIDGNTYTSTTGIYAATVEISQAEGVSTNVTATGTSSGIYASLAKNGETPIKGTGELTISAGEVTATATSTGAEDGIYADETVTINGGEVSATGTDDGIEARYVTISGGTVNATGADDGIYADETVTINGGTVNATGADDGIDANETVTIKGGTVNATGTDDGIEATYVTIKGGTVSATGADAGIEATYVTIKGGTVNATGAYAGIYAGDVTISGGTVNAGTVTIGETTYTSTTGIYAATVDISQAEGASTNVTATGKNYGIYAYSASSGGTPVDGTGKVTVSGGTVNATGTSNGDDSASYGIYADETVTISGGTVSATGTSTEDVGYGIYAKGNIAISGGTVSATGTTNGDYSASYGIYASEAVAISGGTVNATGKYAGIYAGDATISGGTVNATGAEDGIYAYDNVEIRGGTVNATGTDDGIYASEAVAISGGTVSATGTSTDGVGYGIYADETVTINGGTVNATGTTNGDDSASYGIYASEAVAISGGTVTATGTYAGIYAYNDEGSVEGTGNVTISGGTVTAGTVKIDGTTYTSDYGIYATTVEIKGGNVDINAYEDGIYAYETVTINGGTVKLTGEDHYYEDGLIYADGDVEINDGSVNIESEYNGIGAANVTISGGNVDINAYEDGIYAYNDGDVNVEISGTSNVYAKGNTAGIYSNGTVDLSKLSGGTVEAVATQAADETTARGGIVIDLGEVDLSEEFKLGASSEKATFPEKGYIFYENTEEPTIVDSTYKVDSIGFEEKKIPDGEDTFGYDVSKSYVKVDPAVSISYQAGENGKVSIASETVGKTSAAIGSTATANEGYVSVGWYNADGTQLSTKSDFVPTKNEQGVYEEATYTAKFEKANIITDDLNNSDDSTNENAQDMATSDSTQTGQDMTTLHLSLALAVVAIMASVIRYKKRSA